MSCPNSWYITFSRCVRVVRMFFRIGLVGNSSLLQLLAFSLYHGQGSMLAPIFWGWSRHDFINHLCQWLLYLPKTRRFWMGHFSEPLAYYTTQSEIALQQRLSLVSDQCICTVYRKALVRIANIFVVKALGYRCAVFSSLLASCFPVAAKSHCLACSIWDRCSHCHVRR